MRTFQIKKPSENLLEAINHQIDTKTKPQGALGRLESVARKVALVQNSLNPVLKQPHLLVFAADHGAARDGVSAYPQEVTFQMVMNFLQGGAAINVFCRQHRMALKVVDAGVNFDFEPHDLLIDAKIAHGTKSFITEKAMTRAQCLAAMEKGAALVEEVANGGCNVMGFGEMGIGNTASASLLTHAFTGIALSECTGRGTGLDDEGLGRKLKLLNKAVQQHGIPGESLETLATYGGFEIAMMAGAMLEAASRQLLVLVDGFIASAAYLSTLQFNSLIQHYSVFCHQSEEKGHRHLLNYLQAEPFLSLGMRLGEGTGCAVAYPIIQSAVNFFNEMASFESAGVSEKI